MSPQARYRLELEKSISDLREALAFLLDHPNDPKAHEMGERVMSEAIKPNGDADA